MGSPGVAEGLRRVLGVFERFKKCFMQLQGSQGVPWGVPENLRGFKGAWVSFRVFGGFRSVPGVLQTDTGDFMGVP